MAQISTAGLPRQVSEILCGLLPEKFHKKDGLEVKAEPGLASGYEMSRLHDGGVLIRHAALSDLMMALGDLLCGELPEGPQKAAFEFRALMLDCSRNGVPKIEFLKDALLRLSMMGLSHFCLYTEDTYEVDGEPLIGFGRGRYSKAEIKELVSFGERIGVELFPCIQTLGHLEHILKHGAYFELMDNNRVINVREPKAQAFVEKLISNAAEPYKSKLVHLGTDEPWGIGRGRALDFEKPVKPGRLYAEHVGRVAKICESMGLTGMIWGDYVLGHSGEKALSEEESSLIPKSLVMDYWSYSCLEKAEYLKNVAIYRKLGYEILVSPGLWNWNRFWGNFEEAAKTSSAFMAAASEAGVKKAMLTMWGDDGQESFFDSNWGSLAFFLSWCRRPCPPEPFYAKRAEAVAGFNFEAFKRISKMENPDFDGSGPDGRVCVSKPLLYDDPLLGYANKCFKDDAIFKHFMSVADTLRALKPASPRDKALKRLASVYAKLVALKFKLARQARLSYLDGDKKALKRSLRLFPDVQRELRKFRLLYRDAWLFERKPFGHEIIDARLGGLEARLESFKLSVKAWLAGESQEIPEFELKNPEGVSIRILHTYSAVSSKNHNALWV